MHWLIPDWPAPANVRAAITTRQGGVSQGQYASLNLATHVGDDPQAVARNREILRRELALPAEPHWLTQVHGCRVAQSEHALSDCEADAVCTRRPGQVCAVLTADCLPLLICDRQGERVCAVHAGWRGLASGIIEQAVKQMDRPGADLLVWLGPAIGPAAFEVGDEVRQAFVIRNSASAQAFTSGRPGHWLADIYALARQRLAVLGVGFVGGGNYCTVTDRDRFFSFRRDGVCGRMASLIWFEGRS